MAQSPAISAQRLAHRRGDYGFDAPYVPIIFIVIGVALLAQAAACFWIFDQTILAVVCLIRRH